MPLSIQMPSSKISQFPRDADTSLTEFISNQLEHITMETEPPALYIAMPEASQISEGNNFQNVYGLADFIEKNVMVANRYAMFRV